MSADRVIAIDGPAGSGKSTVARTVADKLHMAHLDTGAMYRGVAFAAIEQLELATAPLVRRQRYRLLCGPLMDAAHRIICGSVVADCHASDGGIG